MHSDDEKPKAKNKVEDRVRCWQKQLADMEATGTSQKKLGVATRRLTLACTRKDEIEAAALDAVKQGRDYQRHLDQLSELMAVTNLQMLPTK